MKDTEILQAAIDHYGAIHQATKVIEEAGELLQALARWLNGEAVFENVCEETVDLQIMLEQLKLILPEKYVADMDSIRDQKLARLAARIHLPTGEREGVKDHGKAVDE